MIHGIRINSKDPQEAVCPWWWKTPWLSDASALEFTPGLNVLYGPNGSGKSTVLRTIATLLCCYTGGRQLIGQYTHLDLYKGTKMKLGVEPLHDGSPVMYFDPSQVPGFLAGGFDWDFGMTGIENAMFKGSAGETTQQRMGPVLDAGMGDEWPRVEWKNTRPERFPEMVEFLAGDGSKVRPTLLLDEPTNQGLDVKTEIALMGVIEEMVKRGTQVILATHSLFSLYLDDANVIETVPDSANLARLNLEFRVLRALDKNPERLDHVRSLIRQKGNQR